MAPWVPAAMWKKPRRIHKSASYGVLRMDAYAFG
jgi:hypothetical protein